MKRKFLLFTSTLTTLSPFASVLACGITLNQNLTFYRDGQTDLTQAPVVAQSFEPIDFLATIGKKPDYATKRSDQGVYMNAMADYLKTLYGSQAQPQSLNTKIYDWTNKAAFNPSTMLSQIGNKKGVLLTYQSLHVADNEIKQAFGAATYDDLGNDSMLGTYKPNPQNINLKLGNNYYQPRMYDVVKNYQVFGDALAQIYQNPHYRQLIQTNSQKFTNYVADFQQKNVQALQNKTVLVVRPNEKITGNDQAQADNIAIWTPLAYNLLYGTQQHQGLNLTFPKPKDLNWPKSTQDGGYFDPWAINTRNHQKTIVSSKLVSEYAQKADMVIYLVNHTAWNNDSKQAQALIKNSASSVSRLLKAGKSAKNIYFADYSTFYQSMYGILGQEHALATMVQDPLFAQALGGIKLKAPDPHNKIIVSSHLQFLHS